jgi:hypothetical protein
MTSLPLGVVACDVVKNEILRVMEVKKDDKTPFSFLEYALHEKPKGMPSAILSEVNAICNRGAGSVALGYGLCSNGTVGVSSKNGLIVPRCHDCLSMLLGSPKRYYKVFNELKGTLFLSDGWFRNGGDLLTALETKYIPRLGERLAWKGMRLEVANYKYIGLINNGLGDIAHMRKRGKESAAAFEKEYIELDADLGYFEKLLYGPRDKDDFISLDPSETVSEEQFYANIATLEKRFAL